MSFSIKDFFNLRIVEEAILRTDRKSIENRLIEFISVIELPVENFVRQNELVLTTCIGCSDDPMIFKNFIRDLHQSGAAAIVISVGRYVKEIPEVVIAYANELSLPIIEIPWRIRFADIIEIVLMEMSTIQQSNLKCFEGLQKKLLTYYLNGSTLSEAARLIHKELGNQVIIVNTSGIMKGKSNTSEDFINSLTAPMKILESEKNLNLLSTFDLQDIYTVYKIDSKNMIYGYLYLRALPDGSKNDYSKENETLVVRHIVTPISLWFDREQTIFETEMHHKDNYVWSLIKAEGRELEELTAQAKSIGYDLSVPYICMVGLMNHLEESYALQRSEFTSYEQWKFNCIKSIKSEVIRAGKSIEKQVMTTYQKERLIVFLEIHDSNVESTAHNFLDIVEGRIKQSYPKVIISWGIGEKIVHSPYFNMCFIDAKISLDVCCHEKKPGYRNVYHNPSIYRLLSLLYEHKDSEGITIDIIGKLVGYDTENGLDLINTFKAYLKNKGNVSQTARALHLHRQSLLYRLKRIEEITALSLDNADDVFLLELCTRLWDKKIRSL
jgi:purine catabolism regulator